MAEMTSICFYFPHTYKSMEQYTNILAQVQAYIQNMAIEVDHLALAKANHPSLSETALKAIRKMHLHKIMLLMKSIPQQLNAATHILNTITNPHQHKSSFVSPHYNTLKAMNKQVNDIFAKFTCLPTLQENHEIIKQAILVNFGYFSVWNKQSPQQGGTTCLITIQEWEEAMASIMPAASKTNANTYNLEEELNDQGRVQNAGKKKRAPKKISSRSR